MLTDVHFIYPAWLILILVVIAWFLATRKKTLNTPSVIQPITLFYPLLLALNFHTKKQKIQNKRLWVGIIFCLLAITLAQPVFKTPIKNSATANQATDLILVVNTSVSMVLKDYKEVDKNGVLQQFDRMQKTKQVLKQLVTRFKGERLALVVLGNPATLWLPLTNDKNLVLQAIKQLQTTLGGRNSDIGSALTLVDKQFQQPSKQQKMVLLVNDGYAQIGSVSPIQSVKQLVEHHFIVNTLAIGSPKLPKFSLGIGHLIYSPADLKLMRALAKAGKGSMVHAWKNKTVDELLKVIDQPINKPSYSKTRFKNNALYIYPLSLSMLLIVFLLFPIRRLTKGQHA